MNDSFEETVSNEFLEDSQKPFDKNNMNVQDDDDDLNNNNDDDDRVQCNVCERKFNCERIARHQEACIKTQAKQKERDKIIRKKALLKEKQQSKISKPLVKKTDDQAQPKWKEQHQDFLKIMKYNRKVKEFKDNGGDIRDIKPPEASIPSDYVFCDSCSRNFAPHVAERHIPKCKNIISKPKPPSNRTQEQWTKQPENKKQMAMTRQNDSKWSEHDSETTMNTYTKTSLSNPSSENKKQKASPGKPNTTSNIVNQEEIEDQNKFHLSQTTMNSKFRSLSTQKKKKKPRTSNDIQATVKLNQYRSQERDSNIMMKTQTQEIKALPELKNNKYLNSTNIAFVDCQQRATLIQNTVCPHCNRKFIYRAAERHIPICEKLSKQVSLNIKNDKSNSIPRQVKRLNSVMPVTPITITTLPVTPKSTLTQTQPLIRKQSSQIYQQSSKEQNDAFGLGCTLIKFCTFCGGKFQLGHKYCGGCGKKREIDNLIPQQ